MRSTEAQSGRPRLRLDDITHQVSPDLLSDKLSMIWGKKAVRAVMQPPIESPQLAKMQGKMHRFTPSLRSLLLKYNCFLAAPSLLNIRTLHFLDDHGSSDLHGPDRQALVLSSFYCRDDRWARSMSLHGCH